MTNRPPRPVAGRGTNDIAIRQLRKNDIQRTKDDKTRDAAIAALERKMAELEREVARLKGG